MAAGVRDSQARHSRTGRLAWALVLATLTACSSEKPPEPWTLQGETMGTTWSVRIARGAAAEDFLPNLQKNVQDMLDRVDNEMSTYVEESELSRFNRAPKGEWYPASPYLAGVIRNAMTLGLLTDGAFDITVGPLVDLWGFGAGSSGPGRVPDEAEIQLAMKQIGTRYVAIRREPLAIRKSIDGIQLDLSAIAKGHGVDRVNDYLHGQNVTAFLVEVGGEIRASGERSPGQPWKVAIEKPTRLGRAVHRTLALKDMAVATSGDYRNFFEVNGEVYSHTIDPRTGRPVQHELASTTVVAPTCELADGWATALTVIGPEAAYDLAVERDLAVMLLTRRDGKLHERLTPAFQRLFP